MTWWQALALLCACGFILAAVSVGLDWLVVDEKEADHLEGED